MKKLIMGSLLLLLLLTMTGCRSGENGEVYVYSYGDYYDPEVVADFEADTGIRVIQDTYDTAEEKPRSMIQAMNILFHIWLEYQGFYTIRRW